MTSLEFACTVTALAIAAGARSSDPKLEKENSINFFYSFSSILSKKFTSRHMRSFSRIMFFFNQVVTGSKCYQMRIVSRCLKVIRVHLEKYVHYVKRTFLKKKLTGMDTDLVQRTYVWHNWKVNCWSSSASKWLSSQRTW